MSVTGGQAVLELRDVGLCYRRPGRFLFASAPGLRRGRDIWALRGVGFSLQTGETMGVVGRNGSGKSTLAMVCAGVLPPDRGEVVRRGAVQLLSLGLGFQNELTGRENALLSGALLGVPRRRMIERMPEIEAFAELGDFMDEPVRIYSSGMRSRLGFAVATIVEPDVLVLDEVMATGDEAFRARALERMERMRAGARSVLVISHSSSQLRSLCSSVLWLEKGRLVQHGDADAVLGAYSRFCKDPGAWMRENGPLPD